MMLIFLALVSLAAWVHLALGRGAFWRANIRLADAPPPAKWPEIVAVIPARDEFETIAAVVSSHLHAEYPGAFSIVLVDDQSIDGTAEKAQAAADAIAERKHALEIIRSKDLPAGWSGKLWAMHQGIDRAKELAPNAEYLLLTDADIVFPSRTLRKLVAKAEAESLSLTSLMARLDIRGAWGGLLVPAFIFFFQKLFPFPRVNNSMDNTAAAAGGCMLVRTSALEKIDGVSRINSDLIDDCALAREIKNISPAEKIWLGLADREAISLRDNSSLHSIWMMVARTAFAQLRYSPVILVLSTIAMALIYLAPPLITLTFALHENFGAVLLGASAWAIMAVLYWPTLKLYEQEPWQSVLLPVAAAFYMAMTLSSAGRHWRGQGGAWKGRHYDFGNNS